MPTTNRVRGDVTGISIPAHASSFVAGGASFLTEALRAFGVLAADNRVSRVAACEPCAGGSTGGKLYLTVEYLEPAGLDRELFVKFSRDFDDPRRDLQRTEMASEARFVALSRAPSFPIEAPRGYFADYHVGTGTGIIITQRITFGEHGVQPHRRKWLDHRTLADPLAYYRTIVTTLARLAGSHRAGRLAGDIEASFPFDPSAGLADPIAHDAAALHAVLDRAFAFARRCPRLLPQSLRDPLFEARLRADAQRILAHETLVRHRLIWDRDLIALCHWNAHIDNAWFWTDAAGTLRCGLLDWGRVGQITLGSVLWGALSAAHPAIWDVHLDDLLALFVREYREAGGPAVAVTTLADHLTLHMATTGVARVLAFPTIIEACLPKCVDADGPYDPMFDTSDPARNCLTVYTNLLRHWRRWALGRPLPGSR